MADNKRYYWLKLDENFFEDDTIAWLEEQENGKDYLIFYLKLCLKSLQNDGKLIRYVGETLIPYDINALSRLTNTNIDTVRMAMAMFVKIGLIKQLDTGEIYMNQINEMIGTETSVAKRVRKHRAKAKLLEEKTLHCNTQVTKCNTEYRDKSIEIEKEIEIEKKDPPPPYKEISELYNSICISLPKVIKLTDKRKKMIRTRYKEYDNLDTYKELFTKAEESDFLSGRNGKWTNCNFDWLMNENNMIKVLEGNYKNGGKDESRKGTKTNNGKSREKSLNELIKEELKRQGRTSL